MVPRPALASLWLAAALLGGCDDEGAAPGKGRAAAAGDPRPAPAMAGADVVLTTFYPTEYFAGRIAGGLVPVRCPLPAGEDPIFWQPSTEIIAEFQAAGLVVVNGAEFEKWVAVVSLPATRTVDTARGFQAEFVTHSDTTHSHGAGGTHSHRGVDGHTWLDPQNAARQAEAILGAMARRWPQHERAFRDNHARLAADLRALDARFAELAPALKRLRLAAAHPAYNYIAKRYGLTIADVDLPPDEAPTEAAWAAAGKVLGVGDARDGTIVLFESEPLPEIAVTLRSRWGATAVVFSPAESLDAESRAAGQDYLTIMSSNLDGLSAAAGVASRGRDG